MRFSLVKTFLYKKRIDLLPINFPDDVSNVRFSLITDAALSGNHSVQAAAVSHSLLNNSSDSKFQGEKTP